jgi:hypothetical protein
MSTRTSEVAPSDSRVPFAGRPTRGTPRIVMMTPTDVSLSGSLEAGFVVGLIGHDGVRHVVDVRVEFSDDARPLLQEAIWQHTRPAVELVRFVAASHLHRLGPVGILAASTSPRTERSFEPRTRRLRVPITELRRTLDAEPDQDAR